MILEWEVTLPVLTGEDVRKAYIYLPEMYEADPKVRFPVLYMFDGHNVFSDKEATYGKAWGMDRYLTWHKTPLIVAAVECNHTGHERLSEYSPFDFKMPRVGEIKGKGDIYMDWLVNTFKPMVDKRLRTLRDRNHTLIAGSSMGGLMALYGAVAYNDVFQKAACLSPSLWTAPREIMETIRNADMGSDTCIYMDYGSHEIANHKKSITVLGNAAQALYKKRVDLTFRIVPGGNHSEASWEKQIPIFMRCLGF